MRLRDEDFVFEVVSDDAEIVVESLGDIWIIVVAVEVLERAWNEDECEKYCERQNSRDAGVWV